MVNPLTGYLPGSTYWNSQAYANPPAVTTAPRDLTRTAAWADGQGQPQGDAPTRRTPDEGVNRGTWLFPEAKRGQSQELSATMLLVLRSLNDAILNTWLPMTTPADGALNMHWSRWEFPTQMPDVVPHRGVVRLLKSNRIQGSTSMVRRGIGMFMEHDFMNTPMGKKHYLMHLKQINQSVAEGLQFQGIYAMLNSDDWGRKYLMNNGDLAVDTRMERVMNREIDRWAILQQNPNAWAFLDNIITKENDLYNPGTKLNHYLLDSAVSMYITTIPTEQWQYYMRGPAGPEMIRQGVEGFATDSRGNRITETRAFLADEEGAITPLAAKTMIGECFLAYDHWMDDGSYSGYTSSDRDVEYYNETDDVMSRLKVRQMLDHCHRFDENGELYGFDDRRAMRFNLNRFSEQQKDMDFLHHKNSRGERVKVAYFGQIDPYHMGVEDYRDAGRSAVNSLDAKHGFAQGDLARSFRAIRSLFQQAANFSNPVLLQNWFRAVVPAGAVPGGVASYNHPLLGPINVAGGNAYGSFDLPGAGDYTSMGYPVTHLTYGGLKTVATSPNTAARFGQATRDAAQEAVKVIDRLVPLLQAMYPGSIFLDPTYAPAAIRNPTAYEAFFHSVLMAGIVTTTSVLSHTRGADGGGDATEASTVIRQLEDMIVGGLSQYADSIGGVTQTDITGAGGATLIAANPSVTLGNGDEANAATLTHSAVDRQMGLNLRTGDRVLGSWGDVVDYYAGAAETRVPHINAAGDTAVNPTAGALEGNNANSANGVALIRPFTNFIRFTQMVRTVAAEVTAATTEDGLNTLVTGLLGRALILNIVAFTKTTVDAKSTVLRFNQIFARMVRSIPALGAAFDANGPYNWISAGPAFGDTAALERMVKDVIELFQSNPSWVSDQVGGVAQLQMLLRAIVASFRAKKEQVRDSVSRVVAGARAGGPNINPAATVLADLEKVITERHATFVAGPLTWTNTSIKTWIDGVLDGVIAVAETNLIPASVDDPRVAMAVREFRELSIKADTMMPVTNLAAGAAAAAAAGLIGAGFDSIHLSNINTHAIASSIEHNSATRGAAIGARAQDPREASRGLQMDRDGGDETSRVLAQDDQIGASIGSDAYQRGFERSRMAARGAEDRQDTSAYLAGGSRRKRRTVLQDSAYGNERQTRDDVRDARKRARLDKVLSTKGIVRENILAEKITPSMRALYSKLMERGPDDLVGLFGVIFLGTPVTKQALEATIEYDLMHPFNYVCARPHARYTGLTIIKGAPDGGKIGMTMVLFPKVEVADDGTTGVQHTNFTYYAQSVVVNSKMLNITHNAMIDNYHGGLGSGFYDPATYSPSEDEYGEGSFFIFAIPRRERPEGKYISISGTYDWVDGAGNVMRDGRADALTYSTAPFYCGFWGFHQVAFNRPMDLATSSQKYTMEYCAPNNLCCKSMAVYFKGGKAFAYTTQTGHWQQQSVGPGLAKARIAKKPMDNTAYKSVIVGLRQITQ